MEFCVDLRKLYHNDNMKPQIIAFDADDTLWKNETLFQEIEEQYCKLLSGYHPAVEISAELFKTEMQNLRIYGYGIKSFTLSMIETALRITGYKVDNVLISQVIDFGKELLDMPVEILPGVEKVLCSLSEKYKLVVATKGDLLDQERKLARSGLQQYFHHVEIMSDKLVGDYRKLMKALDCAPDNFMMIGNSMKSDILPVLELGGSAVYVPFEVTWAHEQAGGEEMNNPKYYRIERIEQVLGLLM